MERDREESELAKKVKKLSDKEPDLRARAVAQTMAAYNNKPTIQNLRAWDAAKAAFAKCGNKQLDPAERRFANLLEVLDYLKVEGWKVEKSKIYADKRIIAQEPDGSYTRKAIDDYAKRCLVRIDGSNTAQVDFSQRKAQLEVELLEEKKKEAVRENDIAAGRWVLKSEVESMLAARAALLKDGVGAGFIHSQAMRIIEVCGGLQEKAPELIAYWLEEVNALFDRYAAPTEFMAPPQEAKDGVE